MSGYVTPAGPLRAVVEELLRGGVRDVVICPGSRSTPMALALRATDRLRTWVHLDERAGAFFALGAARATRRPVVVLATSGTAVVEFAPAVVEARYGRVPLVLLTADRPPELQGVGAPQTIDQVELYGRAAKWYAELPVPDESPDSEAEVRSTVTRVLDVARAAPAGPVQLNLPYREPLLPAGALALPPSVAATPATAPATIPLVSAEILETMVRAAHAAARPLVVCGPCDQPGLAPAVARLAAALGAPLVADVLANVRSGTHDRANVVSHHDALLRTPAFAGMRQPDLIVRFGATPTSKALAQLLAEVSGPQLLVDAGAGWNRPTTEPVSLVEADPVAFAEAAADAVSGESSADPDWRRAWLAADRVAAGALEAWFASLDEPFEGHVARALTEALPDGAVVVAGNSMPVRDLDAFVPGSERERRFLGNRGANGIDGLLSTTFGIAATQERPVVGIVGDLAFLHDLTALAAAVRLDLDATVVLVDNDGGGIFSFLPQGGAVRPELGLPAHFEELFGTPHGLDLGPVAAALGARHTRVRHHDLAPELAAAVARPGVDVLHLRTDRARNVELHQAALAAVSAALESRA
ncbi:MAG: 2-succinyl-5-enolpyruvyl-6-hydroxy-3-cyclohexene-1-carboxylic-acid synthase [Chloroflexota bacterium]